MESILNRSCQVQAAHRAISGCVCHRGPELGRPCLSSHRQRCRHTSQSLCALNCISKPGPMTGAIASATQQSISALAKRRLSLVGSSMARIFVIHLSLNSYRNKFQKSICRNTYLWLSCGIYLFSTYSMVFLKPVRLQQIPMPVRKPIVKLFVTNPAMATVKAMNILEKVLCPVSREG